jgi:hypothetical protein
MYNILFVNNILHKLIEIYWIFIAIVILLHKIINKSINYSY